MDIVGNDWHGIPSSTAPTSPDSSLAGHLVKLYLTFCHPAQASGKENKTPPPLCSLTHRLRATSFKVLLTWPVCTAPLSPPLNAPATRGRSVAVNPSCGHGVSAASSSWTCAYPIRIFKIASLFRPMKPWTASAGNLNAHENSELVSPVPGRT